MFKRLIITLLLCTSIGFTQCTNNPFSPNVRELTPAEKGLVESDNRFGLKLFKKVIEDEQDKNVFISPLSVSMALGMTYNGANGSTQEAMKTTLELTDLTLEEINESYESLIELLTVLDPKVIFQIANSIWYRQGWSFEEDFLERCETYFDAVVSGLDFGDPGAPDIINGWVTENTNGKITEIVDSPIHPDIVMFLINAIYFKGTWTYEFDESNTQDDWFNLPDGSQFTCEMMEQEANFQYFSNSDFEAIDLPYGFGCFSMTIFLPRPEKNIDSLIAEFTSENWDHWINSFSEQTLTLQFPKFTLEYEIKLNDVLKALGMEIAFDFESADFTKMYKGPERLFISKVKHKTYIKVDEEGTEAAAATSVEMSYTSVGHYMRVDRPFVFSIRENHSGTILFIGKIVEPTL